MRVLESPAGQGEDFFLLPPELIGWNASRSYLAAARRNLVAAGGAAPPLSPERTGETLFRALFSGQVGRLWARSLGAAPERALRLQLRFKLVGEPPGSSLLHALPWELLYQPDTRDFLALSRRTPVVRYLEVARPVAPVSLPAILRILVVLADLPSLAPLELARERREIEEAWKSRPRVEVVFLPEPRSDALREALLGSPFHVLHFMGHGALDRSTGEGRLFVSGSDGALEPISGEAFATLLKDFKTLRLVLLNACETAQALDGEGVDPFDGVATALVMAGLPAVVAMQFPISDPAAIAFSRAVHLRLAAGDPVDAAVTEGRQAIYAARPGTLEWAIPALFTRVSDGRLFDAQGRRASDRPPRATTLPALSSWVRRRSRRALGLAAGLTLLVFGLGALVLGGPESPLGELFRALPWFTGRPALARVRVGAIRIGRYEVSQRAFRAFVLADPAWRRENVPANLQDGEYLKDWPSWSAYPPALGDHPVTRVSWYAAKAFCEWLGGRLPTQKEWQRAAHTAEGRFPWGDALPLHGQAPLNFCDAVCAGPQRGPADSELQDGYPQTAPVDAFPAGQTREGVFNLSGNVWEWCADASGAQRMNLGGSYSSTLEECSTEKPSWEDARLCAADGGFRCVWD